MTNEHYLIVSYFLFLFVSLGLGVVAHRLLPLQKRLPDLAVRSGSEFCVSP